MTGKLKADWIAIEGAYRSGKSSLREIASAHGITEAAIRKHAKAKGWLRDPEGSKRERVKALMAGVCSQEGSQFASRTIESEALEDERDMRLGLQAARLGLQVAALGLKEMRESGELDPKNAKSWSETVALNVRTIRLIRGLDDADSRPTAPPTGVFKFVTKLGADYGS